MANDAYKSDLVDVVVTIHRETDKAVLVSDTGFRTDGKWLPRSQIEIEPHKGLTATVTMRAWLAKEKGFI